MNTSQSHWMTAAVAVVAIVAAACSAAPAHAADDHGHGAATPAKLSLDQGRKWPTDEALRKGMSSIRGIVEPQLVAAHAGKLQPAQYRDLATKVESEVGTIVANCKLEPKADAMLHLVIAQIGAGTDAMAGRDAKRPPVQGLKQVVRAIDDYGRYFDDPGFKPVADRH